MLPLTNNFTILIKTLNIANPREYWALRIYLKALESYATIHSQSQYTIYVEKNLGLGV